MSESGRSCLFSTSNQYLSFELYTHTKGDIYDVYNIGRAIICDIEKQLIDIKIN